MAGFHQEECHFQPRKVDLFLNGGMALDFGKTRVEVIHAPGHTRGHCALFFPRKKFCFWEITT